MTYLIAQIWLGLLITFIIGLILGYLLGKSCQRTTCQTHNAENGNIDTNLDLDSDTYAVETLEGIGAHTGKRFREIGIHTVGDFLRKLQTPTQREETAQTLGIKVEPIHEWASMADLLRIETMDHQFAELAHACGIRTTHELGQQKAEEFTRRMIETNSAGRQLIAPIEPEEHQVKRWIETAQTLKAVVRV